MSDMELSVQGEDGDLGEDYEEEEDRNYSGRGESRSEKSNDNEEGTISGNGGSGSKKDTEHRRMVDITRDKPVKVTVRVVVPVRDHPKFNFVGKLLGPKGNSLKRLQEDTMTKMAILGRGSMRDKHKEEELRISGDPKFSHLNDDLHVEITAFAPPAEAHARIAYALADVRRFLVPDYNDDIRQEQMWEMQILKERPENGMPVAVGTGAEGSGIHVIPGVPGTGTGASSPSNSNGSRSPRTPPSGVLDAVGASIIFPPGHPALRGVPPVQGIPGGNVSGRKRPLIPGGTRHVLSPTKRTVMSILARARTARMGISQDGSVVTTDLA